ncbi:hypothetical protein D3C85_1286440 [compost metagenome]
MLLAGLCIGGVEHMVKGLLVSGPITAKVLGDVFGFDPAYDRRILARVPGELLGVALELLAGLLCLCGLLLAKFLKSELRRDMAFGVDIEVRHSGFQSGLALGFQLHPLHRQLLHLHRCHVLALRLKLCGLLVKLLALLLQRLWLLLRLTVEKMCIPA